MKRVTYIGMSLIARVVLAQHGWVGDGADCFGKDEPMTGLKTNASRNFPLPPPLTPIRSTTQLRYGYEKEKWGSVYTSMTHLSPLCWHAIVD